MCLMPLKMAAQLLKRDTSYKHFKETWHKGNSMAQSSQMVTNAYKFSQCRNTANKS
jgi:hypothetical protein